MIRAELDGIVQKIVQHLLNLVHIRLHKKLFSCKEKLQADAPFGTETFEGGGGDSNNMIDIKALYVHKALFVVQLSKYHQVLGELFQTLRLVGDDV